jgi:hypothetical protein
MQDLSVIERKEGYDVTEMRKMAVPKEKLTTFLPRFSADSSASLLSTSRQAFGDLTSMTNK